MLQCKIPTPTNSVFFHTNNPLKVEEPEKNYFSNKRGRKYVKTTNVVKKRKNKGKEKGDQNMPTELKNIPTTKEPLLGTEEPKKMEAI
jgi:hypothetical protein